MEIRINTEFNIFLEKVTEISSYAGFIIEDSTNLYKKYLQEQKELSKKNSFSDDEKIASKRPVYFDILNKNEKMIGDFILSKSIDELKDSAVYHNNKQLQWLFVEAYELYEKFIVDLYSLVGHLDNDFWDAKDFGEIQINLIKNQGLEWFQKQANKKENTPYTIIKIFDKRLNLQLHWDKKEPLQNYDFLMALISKFRNAIVHDKGFLNKENLSDTLLKGINGDARKAHYEFIDLFYSSQEYENMICLTRVMIYDRFEILVRLLLSYSNLLKELLIKYLNEKQIKAE